MVAKTAKEVASSLQRLGIPAAPVLDLADVTASAQLAARRMVTTVDHPAYGRVPLIDTPLATGAARSGPWRLQPELGEHNDEVIGGLLGRAGELQSLRAEGVVR